MRKCIISYHTRPTSLSLHPLSLLLLLLFRCRICWFQGVKGETEGPAVSPGDSCLLARLGVRHQNRYPANFFLMSAFCSPAVKRRIVSKGGRYEKMCVVCLHSSDPSEAREVGEWWCVRAINLASGVESCSACAATSVWSVANALKLVPSL
jgi:hypothetical protein